MDSDRCFRLNGPRVVAETAEGEAIVVDLGAGTYYTMTGDGLVTWQALVDGATPAEISRAVAEATGESVEPVVSGFVARLAEANLIVERDDLAGAPPVVDLSAGGVGAFDPVFEIYTDLQDLILLDPVHEIDERGWPRVQSAV